MDEAMHPLTLLATGMYGEALPKQNGARALVVPWKYGFKSIKSIVKIRFVEKEPPTTWRLSAPKCSTASYVNPKVDHPRWSQAKERRTASSSTRHADVQRLRRPGWHRSTPAWTRQIHRREAADLSALPGAGGRTGAGVATQGGLGANPIPESPACYRRLEAQRPVAGSVGDVLDGVGAQPAEPAAPHQVGQRRQAEQKDSAASRQ